MSVHAAMENDEAKFKGYLLGEFFWELAQHEPLPPEFVGISQDAVEVLTFEGYDDMRIRVAGRVYDIHLSWRKDVAPGIQLAD
jgi:hypothetical protein